MCAIAARLSVFFLADNKSHFALDPRTRSFACAGLQAIGVDEVASLIDFGIATDAALRSLEKLRDLQRNHIAAAGR